MKQTLVIYYSYTEHTRRTAEEVAQQEQAGLCRVEDQVRPGRAKAYTAGCVAAIQQQRTPIRPVDADLSGYERIIIMAPVWAGQAAPAINNVFDMLPSGRDVEVRLVAASGNSKAREKVQRLVRDAGCNLTHFETLKG